MNPRPPVESTGLLPGLAALALATAYVIALLAVEKQAVVLAVLAGGIVLVLAAHWLKLLAPAARSFNTHEDALGVFAVIAAIVLGLTFHEDHFVLLLVLTVMLTTVATLGLNIQFGYAGVLNFAGASFFGIGAYTSAVLNTHTAIPHLLVLLCGGLLAALIGSLLLLPVLRTRGHYAAVVTIAFALLLKTFLEVNDVLGGNRQYEIRRKLPEFRAMCSAAGRDPATLPITVFGVAEDVDLIKRYGDAGVARIVFNLPPANADEVLPQLDRCAALMRQARG